MRAHFTTSSIETVTIEPRLAAVVRKTVPLADMPRAQREARAVLSAALQASGVQEFGPTLSVWRPPQAGTIDYAPGVFVPDGFEATGDVSLFSLPHGRALHLRLLGPYDAIPEAWGRLFEGARAERLAGTNWEVYAAADASGEPAQTDLYALLA